MLKTLFVLEIFMFLSRLFSYEEKRLDKKIIGSKLMSHAMQEIMTIHILSNISRIEDNDAVKVGQLMRYSVTNIFLNKLRRK